ncbi:probable LRR receptor-like serine/threonine-protein kinase At3g47570 [Cajanus cajan]|uniref:probable LRR receptor-like serine/threonine-protein kinase At3g47570 n=1 Tax=Cajanus cajan TaxID=3821 RepID=UPI00098DAE45|nr:probable LRR receptor-like serine/threonine-protein kinase At3g47570 [Cajanus cajan]
MGSLANLTYLNLSYSLFSGMIPSTLGNLSQLQYLDLGGNYLGGVIPFQIENLRQLQYLDLGHNYLSGEIPFQIGNLKQLQFLNLASNTLSGAIPFQTGNLPLLHTLRLGGNFDIKDKDAEWFSNLSSLTTLEFTSLHNLVASRHLLQTISKFIPNLREMRLVNCSLSDADIKSFFYSYSNFSTSLTILDFSSNLLTSSTFHLLSSLFPNFPSLKILGLSYNNLSSSIFQGNFNFGSKLKELHLENCSLTDRSFTVSSTSTMNSSSSLLYLDLSNNLLKSSDIFHWIFNFTTDLNTLYLNGNLLEGPIPDVFGKAMNSLEVIHLSYNKLQGKIPSFFGNMCKLQRLYLSNNKLNGEISSFFQNSSWCNRHVFQTLDLYYNQITGKIPKSITLLSELEKLYLDGNSLEGDVTEINATECETSNSMHEQCVVTNRVVINFD